MPRLPTPPHGYLAPTVREGRGTDLRHNRRLGWLLRLTRLGHDPDAVAALDPAQRAALVRDQLPELFPDGTDPQPYVCRLEDLVIAQRMAADAGNGNGNRATISDAQT